MGRSQILTLSTELGDAKQAKGDVAQPLLKRVWSPEKKSNFSFISREVICKSKRWMSASKKCGRQVAKGGHSSMAV